MRDEGRRPADERPPEAPRENAGPPGGMTGDMVSEEPRTRPADQGEEGAARFGAGGPDPGRRPEQAGATEDDSAARVSELEDRWRRALADLDNYRKRTARALEEERVGERARTSAEWLPVLDNLERALEHAEAEPGTVIEGVRSVLAQAQDVMGRL
jgi:molecular chaperone GrpE